MRGRFIVGIDEVGRGPLAGPVTVAAVLLPRNFRITNSELRMAGSPLRDSKRLSARQRKSWLLFVKSHGALAYAVAHVQPSVIDRLNIANAANLAATRAVDRLVERFSIPEKNVLVMLDGSLYLRHTRYKARTLTGGDDRYASIKLASIVAKFYRDRLMHKKHELFPEYGFADHVGYGTKSHIRALKKYGPTPLHRQSFIGNFV